MREKVPPLKLVDASRFGVPPLAEADLKTDVCKQALRAFLKNSERAANLIVAPAFAAQTANRHAVVQSRVLMEMFGTDAPGSDVIRANFLEISKRVHHYMPEYINRPREEQIEAMKAFLHNLELFIFHCDKSIYDEFSVFLKSIVIQSWTVFEVLYTDLLKNVVAAYPKKLLHVQKVDSVQRLSLLRQKYKEAFDVEQINNAIGDQCVDALSILRNVLVHKSGMVDSDFKRKCKEAHLTYWASLPYNKEVFIDGEQAADLFNRNTACAVKVIRRVDEWLSA